jgi:hypothetical protein
MEERSSNNPIEHTSNVKNEFRTLIDHLRRDVGKMEDPAAKALFETSAEVIVGLEKAFTDFEKKNEEAWRGK